ncbi:hypothetical protein CEUSTIGMA_g6449.t1 [Chlamydomonas eustigma]|uniref:Uncharacterized protein n=1 Tax=Chlamydomonas eustigma TaxID=1157962 RepID=A0A250X7W5_9CHLO|nr:hypothetical protein CEUSTIGMA_g6449.t1 [Chlamydomonas eustigma]|eukprot:GAX79009.1 hypothetical protein CEUSTIGMA_g6449.t1 [Chlamydomonas eustigma]
MTSEDNRIRDHDRPLSSRGRNEAAALARMLQARGWIPDVVLASNAKRTKQTLEEMTSVMTDLSDVDSHLYGSLYTVNALDGQTRQHIEECLLEVCDDERHRCACIVGHNKGMEEAASSLAGCAVKLKTASAALLQCAADSWKDVLGSHRSDLNRTSREEDYGAAAIAGGISSRSSKGGLGGHYGSGGGLMWTLVDVISPAA